MKGEGMPSGNAYMYRQLNGRRLLTGMVLAILTLGLIVIDLGMGSSGIGPGEVVDAMLGGPDGELGASMRYLNQRRAPILSALRQAPVLERP